MADFNISENYEEEIKTEKRRNKTIPIIIVVVIALFAGLFVFLISNVVLSIEKKETKEKKTDEQVQVSINDPTVKKLYSSVTHTTKAENYNKFVKDKNVTIDTFTNSEKYYYALQFAKSSDFIDTNTKDEANRVIYLLPEDKVKQYMIEFFGNDITYSTDEEITYIFDFSLDTGNIGHMKHSKESNGFKVIFEPRKVPNVIEVIKLKDYYAKLESAEKQKDDSLVLKEKIVYTKKVFNSGLYNVEIYGDYDRTMLIDTKKNIPGEKLTEDFINIDDYEKEATTITYTFKKSNGKYHFVSSKITN